jgi:cobalt-zinc-cadmium resistance protein CzcA
VQVPLALVGGVAALYIRGIHFSVSAGVGFISLFGISIMSGVLLVSRINRHRKEFGMDLKEAVYTGTTVLFRARLMVMTLAMIGLLPAALATGIGSDIQRPLATVIVGGLASSLVFLIVLPAVYYAIELRSKVSEIVTAVEIAEIEEEHQEEERRKHHEEELKHLPHTPE